MRIKPGAPFLLFMLIFLLAGSGCTMSGGGSASSGSFVRGGVAGFPAATHMGWQELPPGEAIQAALVLRAEDQGLNSWRDIGPYVAACKKYVSKRPQQEIAVADNGLTLTWAELGRSLARLERILPELDRQPTLLAKEFRWYRRGPDVGFTGYFEPTLKASWVETPRFNHPLYRLPPDVRKGRQYHDREAIDERGVLKGRGLEIAWVEDKIGAYFLQVQGSGRLEFEDGTVKHVLYAGKNNCSYVSLGRVMKEKGLLEPDNVSMQTIRNYLALHPQEVSALFCENPSYVFFRLADSGPIGAMGVPLLPRASLATDSRVIPLGALMAFSVPLPDEMGNQGRGGLLAGIGLAQDRGGAIKGNRADLFCGAGPWAEQVAGYLDMQGAMFLLVAK